MFRAILCSMLVAASASLVPTFELVPGVYMPMSGLGTWQYNATEAYDAVLLAMQLGYTHIDTALGYNNQESVAKALADSGRARNTYFITSKIPGGLGFDEATADMEKGLAQLGLEYVDLMLTHFPASWAGEGGKAKRQEEWRALEAFQKAGKARAIGVSHYCRAHLLDLLEINTVPIAINQVEYHVGMGMAVGNATDDKDFHAEVGIQYQSFSPLCGPCGTSELINGPLVTDIGKKYGKSGAQVSLKWLVQQGGPVIPKTSSREHMIENIDLFDWELSEEDFVALTTAMSPAVSGGSGPDDSGDCGVL